MSKCAVEILETFFVEVTHQPIGQQQLCDEQEMRHFKTASTYPGGPAHPQHRRSLFHVHVSTSLVHISCHIVVCQFGATVYEQRGQGSICGSSGTGLSD